MDRSEWVLVPRVPTQEMFEAGFDAMSHSPLGNPRRMLESVWSAQIAAAPPPPAEQASGEHVVGAGWIEPSKRDDASLVDATLQLYARALMYGTEQQHNDAMACKAELLRRLAALSQRPVVIEVGAYGSAFDPPNTCRAFTYEHQPVNVLASRLGGATDRAANMSAGDSIDRGLCLLHALEEAGFGVYQLAPQQPEKGETP